jgi:hypothetical protein
MRLKSFNLLKAFSMSHRALFRLLKLNGCFLQLRLGMTGLVPRSCSASRNSALSLVPARGRTDFAAGGS